jgi:predicted AlkP superfamily pyrophosphatase or phosphodiesterase
MLENGFRRRRAARLASATLVACVVGAAVWHLVAGAPEVSARPKGSGVRLVLQITVDQLRGDLATRLKDRWSQNGFRRLYDDGVVYTDAHHGHANTETVVGHVTLATGTDPSVHGMVGNVWLNRSSGGMQYNIEDKRFRVVGNDGRSQARAGHAEPDRPERARSPEAILAPTIADSIADAYGPESKVYAVSLKDRGAVPMAGRKGKAFWWSEATGEFISSSYYFKDRTLPEWVEEWNEDHGADHLDGDSWTLLLDPSTYLFKAHDDMPWEAPPSGQTRVFPHRLDRKRLKDAYYTAVEASPYGDDLLLDFVRRLIRAEDLGDDDVTDYLSVAFSSLDFIGHRYGPDSLETEDALLRLDRVLAVLFEAADKATGRGRTLFVLSSDHGVAEPVEEQIAEGRESGRVVLSQVQKSAAVKKLNQKFGVDLIRKAWPPYVYLDNEGLKKNRKDPDVAARLLAAEYRKLPGVEAAFTRGEILGGLLPDTPIARSVRRSFHPERSGDIHVVPKFGWQIAYEGENVLRYATGHGTPWSYDTFVPLVFSGTGLRKRVVDRRVETVDVAPSIAALLDIPPPAMATGKPLPDLKRWP